MRRLLRWFLRCVRFVFPPPAMQAVRVPMRCSMCGVKNEDVGHLVSNGVVYPPHCPDCAVATVEVRALSRHQGGA